jgi:phospholipid/cholesterol/gamma-HCH transport system ATP-binding protein
METSEAPVVQVEHVTCVRSGKLVLDDVSLEVQRGEIFGVMGLSGAGKSTLLHLLMGLIRPQEGRILINGTDITQLDDRQMNEVRLRMGMSFQYSALFDSMTVFDNVAFGLRRRHVPETEIRTKVAHYLDVVGMDGTEDLMPANLSGGMKKRVSVARALSTEPEVMLYDEPTSGLDPVLAAVVDHLIVKLRDDFGVCSIIVTHDVQHLFAYADRALMLYEAKAIEVGTPDELRRSDDPVLQQFIGGVAHGPIQV